MLNHLATIDVINAYTYHYYHRRTALREKMILLITRRQTLSTPEKSRIIRALLHVAQKSRVILKEEK